MIANRREKEKFGLFGICVLTILCGWYAILDFFKPKKDPVESHKKYLANEREWLRKQWLLQQKSKTL